MQKKEMKITDEIEGLKRVWIENVYPEIDDGNFPIKRIVNEKMIVEADLISDSIDEISARLLYKHEQDKKWSSAYFSEPDNDRFKAEFNLKKVGNYQYTIEAWIDEFSTWKKRFLKKAELGMDIDVERMIGLEFFNKRKPQLNETIQKSIQAIQQETSYKKLHKILENELLLNWTREHLAPSYITKYPRQLMVTVDRLRAQFSAWYEVFPRSLSRVKGKHGSFQDLIAYLPQLHKMGFDVIYLPPIHPIGLTNRKGKNNSVSCEEGDPGSPWAIGDKSGGHKAFHKELGTADDFKQLIATAKELNMEIALDFALQCSPDHPYLKKHPSWFKHLPDGSLQYAENPPKKYQDIYPFNFASNDWMDMWQEFKSIILYWIKMGVYIFRVDNPHTKPFIFWQWLICEVKKQHPETLFLSEAFTRPKVMYQLAKCGFSQSYTYFTWRNSKEELQNYIRELLSRPIVDFFRPNFWANTPDILHEYLQTGGRIAFMIRFILAATLGSNYGIYGPVYENCIHEPLHEGSEEYLNSEKYELKHLQTHPENIIELITQVNRIRRKHKALQNFNSLHLHTSDNPQLICYSKRCFDEKDILLMVVNLDYQYKQSGFLKMELSELGITSNEFEVHDLLTGERYLWQEGDCYVELDPDKSQCAHIFQINELQNE